MVTTGAGAGNQSDLAIATWAAADIEFRFGMGAGGLTHYSEQSIEALLCDPSVARLIKRRLASCFERAKTVIVENRDAVEAISHALEGAGHLDRAAIGTLLKEHPIHLPPRKAIA